MAIKEIKKRFDLPKVDGYGIGRKNCAANVDAEWRLGVKYEGGKPSLYWEFSACGNIWNTRHTDIICGGQCLDELNKIAEIHAVAEFREVYDLWKKYHLNGMTAGSPAQESAIKEYKAENAKQGKRYDYTEACEFLEARGLLDDEGYIYEGKPYRYGTAWLVTEIPEADKERIRALFGITRADEERAEAEAIAELEKGAAA